MITQNRLPKPLILSLVTSVIVSAHILNPLTATYAQAQDKCLQAFAEAKNKYYTGEFSAAIALVEECLKKSDLNTRAKKSAYELLALFHIANDDTMQATSAVQNLLELEPDYDPKALQELDAPPRFISLVDRAKQALPPKKSRSKKWLLIGGGTAIIAVGITAFVLSNGTDEGFVKPPGRPR